VEVCLCGIGCRQELPPDGTPMPFPDINVGKALICCYENGEHAMNEKVAMERKKQRIGIFAANHFLRIMMFMIILIGLQGLFSLPCTARDITVSLDVPFFSQRDSGWGCEQLGNCSGTSNCNTGKVSYSTIYSYGCFLSSKAMLFNYYQSDYTDPGELNSCLLNNDGYSQDTSDSGYDSGLGYCLMNWNDACAPSGVSYIASYSGDVDSLSDTIDAELSSGYPVLADVRYNTTDCDDKTKQHMVVIIARTGSTYIINDPWDEYETSNRTLDDSALGQYYLCKIHLYRYFKTGDRVKATASVNIREQAGMTSTVTCTAFSGNRGKIIDGPQQVDNYTWWKISWDNGTGDCGNGTTGWSVVNYIRREIEEDVITHSLTPPSKTTVSRGGTLTFSVEETNNSSSYYSFYVQPYVKKPNGTTVNFKQISTGLAGGKTRKIYGYLRIPSSSELGTFAFGVKLTDTNGNLIDNDSFEFTVSGSTYASKRSARKLKRLMRNPEAQVVEEEGWKVVIVPERNR